MSYCLNPACPQPTDPQNATAIACPQCGTPLRLQDRFRAVKPIGQGGFGRTFLAVDEQHPSKPPCVIKQSLPDQLTQREQAERLFEQEAQRLAELGEHPQIPQLLAHCQQGNYQYLVQEWIAGQTLAQRLRDRGTFAIHDIEQILQSLLPVLEFIHAREVIHRDIKPDNIICRPDGTLVLVDFGAAKHASGTALLKTGTAIGSAEYIAPEQTRGKATYASDLYSLGVTCVHLLTQMSPFDLIDGDNQWVWQDWVEGTLPPEWRYGLNRMIAPALNQRFQSATEARAFFDHPQLPPAEQPALPVPTPSRSPRLRKPLTITAITAFSIGAIAAGITLPQLAAESNRVRQIEARTYVGSIGRAQQAYYLEHERFAPDVPSLAMGIKEETEFFKYKVLAQGKTPDGLPYVQQAGIPKKGDLKNYVGYVWVSTYPNNAPSASPRNELTTVAIFCESQNASIQVPDTLTFAPSQPGQLAQIRCPAGYTKIGG